MKKLVKVLLLLSVSLNLVASDYNASTIVDLENKAMTWIDWDRIDECYWEECDPGVHHTVRVHKIYNKGKINTSFSAVRNRGDYVWYAKTNSSSYAATQVQLRYDFNLYYIGTSAFEDSNIREFYYYIMREDERCDRYHIAEHFGPNVTAASTSEMTFINSYAFRNSLIEYMETGPKVRHIGLEAFAKCANLRNFVALATTPPVASTAFDPELIQKCRLTVPRNCISKYKEAEGWSSFGYLEDLDGRSYDDPASISLGKDTTVRVAEKIQLPLVLTPSVTDTSVTWTSSDNSVLTFINGSFTGVASGTATVTATTSNGLKSTVQVRVVSTDNKLTALSTSAGTLSPAFSPEVLNYNVTVTRFDSIIQITATKSFAGASVAGEGPHALNYGNNSLPVTVTAEDGSVRTYTLNVYRLQDNTNLASVTSSIPFSPAFDANIYEYTAMVLNQVSAFDLQGVPEVSSTSVTGFGTHALAAGDNLFPVTVTTQDSITGTYTFLVHRKSDDATLVALTASPGTFSPSFNPAVHNYTLAVPYAASSTYITATLTDTLGSLSGTGPYDVSGGTTTIVINTIADDPAYTDTYTIHVYHQNTDATLSSLSHSAGTLSPSFSPSTYNYTLTVPYDVTGVDLSATLADSRGTLHGTGYYGDLPVGDTEVVINVAAEDTTYTNRYNVRIHRQNNEATLSSLSLSAGPIDPPFDPSVSEYSFWTTYVPSIDISASLADTRGSISGAGHLDIPPGSTALAVRAFAEDSTYSKVYVINIYIQSNDATLSAITPSVGTLFPPFSSSVYNYTLSIPHTASSTEISATATDEEHAQVFGTGRYDISGDDDDTPITISTIAEDPIYTGTYTLHIRHQNNNPTLSALSTSAGPLTPAFDPSVHEYALTDSVPYAASSINIIATLVDPSGTISVAGDRDLATGDNTITINTTAEDHTYTGTYSINAYRLDGVVTLQSLTVSGGTLSPNYSPAVHNYKLLPPVTNTRIQIEGVPTSAKARIQGNGEYELDGGLNEVLLKVTAEDNSVVYYSVLVGQHTEIERVEKVNPSVYIENNRLYVNTPAAERIAVYTPSGRLLYAFGKPSGAASLDLFHREQVLVVRGGTGWSVKLVNK